MKQYNCVEKWLWINRNNHLKLCDIKYYVVFWFNGILTSVLDRCWIPSPIYIYIYRRHYYGVQLAHISMALSCHWSLSSIAFGWSSMVHPISVRRSCRYVLVGRLTSDRLCEVVHRSTSLMRTPLLLQLCPACLVCLDWMLFELGVRSLSLSLYIYIYIYIYVLSSIYTLFRCITTLVCD